MTEVVESHPPSLRTSYRSRGRVPMLRAPPSEGPAGHGVGRLAVLGLVVHHDPAPWESQAGWQVAATDSYGKLVGKKTETDDPNVDSKFDAETRRLTRSFRNAANTCNLTITYSLP